MEASLETAADRHVLVRSPWSLPLRLPWICQLWDLAGSEAPKQRLADARAVEALPQAKSQHREVAAVQKNSAAALRNLAAGCGGLEQRLADAGAVQALLEAMAQHGGVAAVQQNVTAALRNLTAGSEALEQRLAEAGAVEALLQAMAQHRAVAAVQENAAGARVEPGRQLRGPGAEARRCRSR